MFLQFTFFLLFAGFLDNLHLKTPWQLDNMTVTTTNIIWWNGSFGVQPKKHVYWCDLSFKKKCYFQYTLSKTWELLNLFCNSSFGGVSFFGDLESEFILQFPVLDATLDKSVTKWLKCEKEGGHCWMRMGRKSLGTYCLWQSSKRVIFLKITLSLTAQIISIISFPLQTQTHSLQTHWKKDLSCWQFSFKCGFLQWFEILCGEIEFPISSSWMPLNM